MTLYNADMVQRAVDDAVKAAVEAATVKERQRIVNLLHYEAAMLNDPTAAEAIHESIRLILDPCPDLIL
jgi:hypothetical protein